MDSRMLLLAGAVAGSSLLFGAMGAQDRGGAAAPPRAASVQPPAAQAPAPAAPSAARFDRGARLLAEFLGHSSGAGAERGGYRVDALIVLLPDPFDSHLDWGYDLYLEAVRRAFESSGYVTDRFWLPGRRDTVSVGGQVRPAREVHPGVFLFRGTSPADSTLRLLYVVHEIPTGGAYKDALREALAERDRILAAFADGAAPRSDTLKILGPVFSGSARSLQLALAPWRRLHPGGAVRVLSGSATDSSIAGLLRADGTRFHATVHPDATLSAILRDSVLPGLDLRPSEVAILKESSTQYGRSMGRAEEREAEEFLMIPFPMNISQLRSEYARNPEAADPAGAEGERERPRIPLSLQDSVRPKDGPPLHSGLTAPATDVLLEEITRTLRAHRIRMVGLQATDVRDKLFLGDYLRRRHRDVQLFTFESNGLYLRTDYNRALRGMLVLSSYPLLLENQRWSPGGSARDELLTFPSDAAIGIYNAALMLLGADSAAVEYGAPAAGGERRTRRPPVWLTAVGTRSFLPVHAFRTEADTAYVTAAAELRFAPPSRRSPISFLAFGTWIVLGGAITLLSAAIAWRAWRNPPSLAGPAPAPGVGAGAVREGGRLYRQVEAASLRVHAQIYTVFLLVALAGLYLPAAVLIWHDLRQFQWPPGGPAWWFGWVAISAGVLLWTAAAALSVHRGVVLAWRARTIAHRYALRKRWWGDVEGWLWMGEIAGRLLTAVLGVAYFVLSLAYVARILGFGPAELQHFRLFFHRAVQMDSGVSPLPPLLLTGAGLATWSLWHLERIRLLSREPTPFEEACLRRVALLKQRAGFRAGRRPEPGVEPLFAVEEIRRRLWRTIPQRHAVVWALLLVCLGVWLLFQFGRTLESLPAGGRGGWNPFEAIFQIGVLGSLGAVAWAVYRLVSCWRALDRFLRAVEVTELRAAFERLPPQIARLTRLSVLDPPARATVGAVESQQWKQLYQIIEKKADELGELTPAVRRGLARVLRHGCRAGVGGGRVAFARRARGLDELFGFLRLLWVQEPSEEDIDTVATELAVPVAAGGGRKLEEALRWNTSGRLRRSYAGRMGLWLRVAEELAAVSVVDYIEWVLRQLRRLTLFLLASLLFTTVLLSSYPFQPQSTVKLLFFFLLAGTIGSFVMVLNQMNRNDLLSRITGTDPGRITWDLPYVSNLLFFVGIPLLAAISAEFPEVRGVLFSWLEPMVRTLAKS